MNTVVVTRAAAQAAVLMDAIRERGFRVLPYPTLAIGPAPDQERLAAGLMRLADYRLVVFVSPNAIDGAFAALAQPWPPTVPIAVMGPGSVACLERHGVSSPGYHIVSPSAAPDAGGARFDSESLYEALDIAALGSGPVLFVKGNGGRTWLGDRLRAAGIAVESLQSYTRTLPQPEPAEESSLLELIGAGSRAQLVITSTESVGNFLELLHRAGGHSAVRWARSQRLVVPHARIAENATAQGFVDVVLSGPGDAGIASALK